MPFQGTGIFEGGVQQAGVRGATQGSQDQGGWEDVLPPAMGIGGQIAGAPIGAAAGTLVAPGAGTVAGEEIGRHGLSAAGQGLGEVLREGIRNVEGKQKGLDWGRIGSETGQGALWSFLPGGQATKAIANPLLRAGAQTAIRGTGGAAVGAGVQAMQNVQQGQNITKNVPEAAETTAAANVAIPGALSFAKGGGQYVSKAATSLFEGLPREIQSAFTKQSAKLSQLAQQKIASMVGNKYLNLATQLGINDTHTPQQAVDMLESAMTKSGGQLNQALGKDYATATLEEVRNAILNAHKQVAPGMTDIDLGRYAARVDDFLKQKILAEIPNNPNLAKGILKSAGKSAVGMEGVIGKTTQTGVRGGEQILRDMRVPQLQAPEGTALPNLMKTTSPEEFPVRGGSKTLEQMVEEKGGWQPGQRTEFDHALGTGNIEAVKKLLPQVPKDYALRMKDQISSVLAGKGILGGNLPGGTMATAMNPEQLADFVNNKTPIDLNLVNKVKQAVGQRYTEGPEYEQAYHNLQNLIEQNSGQPARVAQVNQAYNALRDMWKQASKVAEKTPSNVFNYEQNKQRLLDETLKMPGMAKLIAGGSVIGGPALLGHKLLGPILGLGGGGIGGAFLAYRLLTALEKSSLSDRGTVDATAKAVQSMGKPIMGAITMGKAAANSPLANPLFQALQQAGVRIPEYLSGQGGQ